MEEAADEKIKAESELLVADTLIKTSEDLLA